jgi:hypothetical protein
MKTVRKPDAGNPHVRFDERREETSYIVPPVDSTLLVAIARKVAKSSVVAINAFINI